MLYGNGIANGGSTARSFSTGTTESFKQFITYQKEIKGHRLSLTGVHENYELEMQGMQGSKQGFPLPYIYEFTAATKINNLSSSKESYATEAYLLKFDYEYKFKYYLNSSIRREGSSKFHKNNRWGNFAALGLAWRVTGENFMEDITWINNMRLKVSYGTNGNDNLPGYYPYQALYATGYNNGAFSGITCASFANEDLTWEKQNKFNTGVDVSILKSLFDFQVEYFSNKTTDLLFYRPIPVSTGKSSVAMNIGSMVNKGFEFTVNAHPIRKEFKWDISFNITSYKNEVTELAEDQIRHSNKMYEVGKSAYEFYLAKSAGIDSKTGNYLWWRKFERDAEGNKIPVYLKDQEGQFVYDKKGNRVKAPNSKTVSNGFQLLKEEETTDNQLLADEYYRGTSLPDFYGGLSNNFSYKGFNLGIDLTYSIGGKMIDHTYGKLMHRGSLGMNWHKDILNAWTPENKNTDVPSVIFHGSQIGMQNEDRYLIDASYLNISNINLSYNLPNRFIEKFNLKGVKLKVSGENLYQFNKRKGLNAMMNMTGGSGSDSYSLLRTYTFGVTVNL